MGPEAIIIIVAVIVSIVLHEMAHGYAANWLGDPTARLAGRLSLNPIAHLDPIGSIIVPALLFFANAGFIFGWAKPVPYNPYNLSDQRYGEAKVAAAGPAINILIALIFSMLIRAAELIGLPPSFMEIAWYVVFFNILLALFNMIPIPPLDGSKILTALLPYHAALRYRAFVSWFEQYGLIATLLFIFIFIQILWVPFSQVVFFIVEIITGVRVL